jgi:hypothetical protein
MVDGKTHARMLWAALTLVGTWACSEGSDNTLPLGVQQGSGSIEVTVITMGDMLDPDGYIVAIDEDLSQAVGVNGAVEFTSLLPGQYDVSLSEVAQNCEVAAPNPQSVTVIRDIVSEALFSVRCAVP